MLLPLPVGLEQLAQRQALLAKQERVGERRANVNNRKFTFANPIATPTPALPRAPCKMRPHFAWVPARCGLRPAGEGEINTDLAKGHSNG